MSYSALDRPHLVALSSGRSSRLLAEAINPVAESVIVTWINLSVSRGGNFLCVWTGEAADKKFGRDRLRACALSTAYGLVARRPKLCRLTSETRGELQRQSCANAAGTAGTDRGGRGEAISEIRL